MPGAATCSSADAQACLTALARGAVSMYMPAPLQPPQMPRKHPLAASLLVEVRFEFSPCSKKGVAGAASNFREASYAIRNVQIDGSAVGAFDLVVQPLAQLAQ
jgi:hypothetical protein